MKRRKLLILLILLGLTMLLAGCRTRTTGQPENAATAAEGASGLADTETGGEAPSDEEASGLSGLAGISGLSDAETGGETSLDAALSELPGDGEEKPEQEKEGQEQEKDGPGSRARENPDAARKEYDENAPAEVVPGTERLLHGEGEGSGAPVTGGESEESVSRVAEQAQRTATQTVRAQEAEQTGVDPEAEQADSALTYFTVLLNDRMSSLFECQRANVYWETAQDHVTVYRTSPEHALILQAGAYDVSARLLEENLKVDDGWVVRKNPGVIVKIVDGSVLGSGVTSTGAARAVWQSLLRREGWSGIDAVRNGRVVLLSGELLQTPWLQTAAMLGIAKAANPEVFADVDWEEALQMLSEEATGALPAGIFLYQGEQAGRAASRAAAPA